MKANSKLNHSTSHLLAAAILKLYPDTNWKNDAKNSNSRLWS